MCSLQLLNTDTNILCFRGNGVDNYSQIKDSVRCWAAGGVTHGVWRDLDKYLPLQFICICIRFLAIE